MDAPREQLRITRLSRRTFLVQSGVAACGVAFGAASSSVGAHVADFKNRRELASLAPNWWTTLYADGSIDIVCPGIEMGQGIMSTLPRYVAEELDADWERVHVINAPADETRYGNPFFYGGSQIDAGSRTALGYFRVLRIAGAQARYALVNAAARKWHVPVAELSTADSFVIHAVTRRRISYGELVVSAIVPKEFPAFIDVDDRPDPTDIFFGPPPPLPTGAKQLPPVKLKRRRDFKFLGIDAPRIDIPHKVNGSAQYGLDMMHADQVYAAVETGPVRGAEPEAYDEASARSVPGVSDVVRLPYGVAAVADSFATALAARQQLKVTWRSAPAASDYDSDGVLEDFARIAADSQSHPGVRVFSQGDAAATLAALSQHRTETFEIRSQLIYHATMEPQNATARIAADGKSAEVWVSTQWPTVEKAEIAKAINLAPERVTLHMPCVIGGGFGRRSEPGAAIDAVQIAKHTGKTVKVIWTREDDLRRNPHRQALVCRIEAAVSAQGRILATRHRVVADSWFARFLPDFYAQATQSDPGNWTGAVYAYDVPLQVVDNVTVRRAVDVCYMRGIGVAQTQFGLESLIDRIALQHGKDPLAYRISMLQHRPRAVKVLETAAAMADWPRPRAGRALGMGYTNYTNSHAAAVAEVSVNRESGEIRVHNVWSAIDAGFALQPAIVASQTEGGIMQGLSIALFEQVTVRKGVTQESNFDSYRMLRMSEAPEVAVKVLSTDNAPTGVGEVGIIPIAPAVNNAVARLIGKHMTGLPMRPDAVLSAIRS